MVLKRRAFLQRSCLLLAGLGVSEAGLLLAGSRYRQVLAQSTRRKLALLIGINEYLAPVPSLSGCLTDVELQRELLIHRFGFQPSDVLVLTNQQATRDNIEAAFTTHLAKQAGPGDVVIFHFSGYGRHVRLKVAPAEEGSAHYIQRKTLMPVDGVVPSTANQPQPVVNDILEDTLFLLLRSLATDQITTILDTSYAYRGSPLQGSLQIRARPNPDKVEPANAELALQEQLLRQMNLSRDQVEAQQRSRQLPGIVLAAAGPTQAATEAHWHGFSAGLFTYALTQHLWNTTSATTLRVSLSQATTAVQLVGNQEPELSGQQSRLHFLPAYNFASEMGADGAVTAIENNGRAGSVWLAGLPTEVLENYQANSILMLLPQPVRVQARTGVDCDPASADTQATSSSDTGAISFSEADTPAHFPATVPVAQGQRIRLNAIDGLAAKGELLDAGELQAGQWIQEAIRVVPQNTRLTIALDASLERVERVDATSAFSGIPHVSSVVTGEPADYLFTKVKETLPLQVQQSEGSSPWHVLVNDATAQGSYGLFSLGRRSIANTVGEVGEAVKAAVRRLTPKLQTLQAAKLLGLTVNERSSRLGVSATLETTVPQQQVLLRQETLRAPWPLPQVAARAQSKAEREGSLLRLPVGTRIQYRIHNYSDRPVYLMLLGLDSSVNAFAFYPVASVPDKPEVKPLLSSEVITPGETLIVPRTSDAFEWVIRGPAGLSTTYLILSREPLNQTLAVLEPILRQNDDSQQIAPLPNVLEVVQSVLQDLNRVSAGGTEAVGLQTKDLALDVNAWATLRFVYQVA